MRIEMEYSILLHDIAIFLSVAATIISIVGLAEIPGIDVDPIW